MFQIGRESGFFYVSVSNDFYLLDIRGVEYHEFHGYFYRKIISQRNLISAKIHPFKVIKGNYSRAIAFPKIN